MTKEREVLIAGLNGTPRFQLTVDPVTLTDAEIEGVLLRRRNFIAACRRTSIGFTDERDKLIVGKPVRTGEVGAFVCGPAGRIPQYPHS